LSVDQGTGAAALSGSDEQRVAEGHSSMLSRYGRAFELAEAIAKDKDRARTGTESLVDAGVRAGSCGILKCRGKAVPSLVTT
jgi:hypothetical protein